MKHEDAYKVQTIIDDLSDSIVEHTDHWHKLCRDRSDCLTTRGNLGTRKLMYERLERLTREIAETRIVISKLHEKLNEYQSYIIKSDGKRLSGSFDAYVPKND